MTDKTETDAPQDPSRRDLIKAGVVGATALGTIGSVAASMKPTAAASHGKNYQMLASSLIHTGDTQPFTSRMWSPIPFKHRVRQVAEAGFTGIGLIQDDIVQVLDYQAEGSSRDDKLKWMKGILDEHGITNIQLDFLTSWLNDVGTPGRAGEQPIRELLIDAARILRARDVKCGNFGANITIEQSNRNFKELCKDFEPHGTMVSYEILGTDPHGSNFQDTLAIVDGADNGGILLDIWHLDYLNVPMSNISKHLKAKDLTGIELGDGWHLGPNQKKAMSYIGGMGFTELTMNLRACVGEGNIDTLGFISELGKIGYDGPFGNEVLSEQLRRWPISISLPHVYNTSITHLRHVLDGVDLPNPIRY